MKTLNKAPRFTLFKDIFKQLFTLAPLRKGGVCFQLPKTLDQVKYYFSRHVALFSSPFTEEKYVQAKANLISFYQSKGFRDVSIVQERLHDRGDGKLDIHLKIEEGQPYTIRHIQWAGNYVYPDALLYKYLNLKEGKPYDPLYIKSRLLPGTRDITISDLYNNHGYLFFKAEAIETSVEDHQVDLEIRIREGKQATIQQVNIVGNTITHDEVILRELLTLPGEKYNRALVIESLRNLAMLDFFKTEKLVPEIELNETSDSVNITYSVEERPKFDLKLNAHYSKGLVLELSLGSSNVALKNLFKGKSILGAGQAFHISGGLQGKNQKNFSLSIQEPWLWLGGNRYILAFHIDGSYQSIKYNRQDALGHWASSMMFPLSKQHKDGLLALVGGRIGLGKKLGKYWEGHWGMDYHCHSYKRYELLEDNVKRSGLLHDFNIDLSLIHNSVNDPNYPTSGWSWSNALTITPPYTLLGCHAAVATLPSCKEYIKFITDFSSFHHLPNDFVLNIRGHAGLVHNLSNTKPVRFERFYLGGTVNMAEGVLGANFVSLRGYPDDSLTPKDYGNHIKGGVLFNKLVAELRYPIIRSPAYIYLLGFAEIGDCWSAYSHYNLYHMKKSVGGGIRFILPIPMIPMLGLDFGYRLDPVRNITHRKHSFEYHFTFGSTVR